MRKRKRFDFSPLAAMAGPSGEYLPVSDPQTPEEAVKELDAMLARHGVSRLGFGGDRFAFQFVGAMALGFCPRGEGVNFNLMPQRRWADTAEKWLRNYRKRHISPQESSNSRIFDWAKSRIWLEAHKRHVSDLVRWLRQENGSKDVPRRAAATLRQRFDAEYSPDTRCSCIARVWEHVFACMDLNRSPAEVAEHAIAKRIGMARGKLTHPGKL